MIIRAIAQNGWLAWELNMLFEVEQQLHRRIRMKRPRRNDKREREKSTCQNPKKSQHECDVSESNLNKWQQQT